MGITAIFIMLFVVGLLMIGAEIFVPGGILGTFGALTLVSAVVVAYFISPTLGLAATVAGALLALLSIALWILFFPRTRFGRHMTLAQDGRDFKAPQDGLTELMNLDGKTLSNLRPAGFAQIDGRRIDVVSEGGMIPRDARVRVTAIEGNRVVVRAIPEPTITEPPPAGI